jgi:hypothetical protein
MTRAVAAFVALIGIGAVVMNKRFGRASLDASRNFYGVTLPEGSKRQRFTVAYSRILAVVIGSILAVAGILGTIGVLGAHP